MTQSISSGATGSARLHNINPYLGRIQSRTLVMHITNDLWLNFKLAERAVDSIPGADLIAEESPVAHYGVFSIINHRKHDPKFVAFPCCLPARIGFLAATCQGDRAHRARPACRSRP